VQWDPAIARYAGISNLNLAGLSDNSFGTTQIENGKLLVSWSSLNLLPVSPPDNDPIFSIAFDLIAEPGSITPVVITGPIEIIAKNFVLIDHEEIPGSITIKGNVSISGKITYAASPLINSVVNIDAIGSAQNFLANVNQDGMYSQELPADIDYELTASKNSDPTTYLNYLNAADVAVIQRHITQTQILEHPYKLIAGDINKSKSITILDKVLVEAVILGIQNFPNNAQWILLPADYHFSESDPYTYPSSTVITDLIQDVVQDFVGIHLGDVVQNTSTAGRINTTEQLTLDLKSQLVAEGQFKIEVRGKNFKGLSALQAAFELDKGLELISVKPKAISPSVNVVAGSVRMMWVESEGKSKTIAEDEVLFELYLQNLNITTIPINERVSLSQHFNANAFSSDLTARDVNINWSSLNSEEVKIESGEWYPNPFSESIATTINIKNDQEVTIQIADIRGKQINNITVACLKGINKITYSAAQLHYLSPGIYFITVVVDGITKTTKLVKQ
jgi:hypothetical protein